MESGNDLFCSSCLCYLVARVWMGPPLWDLVTSKSTYTIGSISIILLTFSYYFAFPPVIRNPCLNYLSTTDKVSNQILSSSGSAQFYDSQLRSYPIHSFEKSSPIVVFHSQWITNQQPAFNIHGNDVLVFLHIQVSVSLCFSGKMKLNECVCLFVENWRKPTWFVSDSTCNWRQMFLPGNESLPL